MAQALYQLALVKDYRDPSISNTVSHDFLAILPTFSTFEKVMNFMTRNPQDGENKDGSGELNLRWGVGFLVLDEELRAMTQYIIYRGQDPETFKNQLQESRNSMIKLHLQAEEFLKNRQVK